MARYQWHGENFATDVVSALTAALAGGVATYLALNNKSNYALLANGIMGVGGLVGKNYVGGSMAHEILEAIGYGGFYGLGTWAAATLKNANNIPVWVPPKRATTSYSPVFAPSFQPVSEIAPSAVGAGYGISVVEI